MKWKFWKREPKNSDWHLIYGYDQRDIECGLDPDPFYYVAWQYNDEEWISSDGKNIVNVTTKQWLQRKDD